MKEHQIPVCKCTTTGAVRPNILLYNDSEWNTDKTDAQEDKYKEFMAAVKSSRQNLLIFEIGINPK